MPRDPAKHPLDDRIRFEHMRKAASDALRFIEGRTRADLDTDPMLARALVNAVQEIGEAAARVSPAGRARAPAVPWGQIVGMRHRLVHDYWQIRRDYLWSTALRDVRALMDELDRACANWPLPPLPD
jgi:uncharacterized protein with HEPN domain